MTRGHLVASETSYTLQALQVGTMGFFVAVFVVLRVLVPAGWDPSAVASFGIEAESTLKYAQARLEQVTARPLQGHDGKFFFVQANDPLLFDPQTNAAILDRPTYRSQRMLYPLLAGAGGLLPPEFVIWGLVVINVLAMGAGAGLTAAYAGRLGLSPWFGLAFPFNPGMLHELTVDGAGIVAFALCCGAVLALKSDQRVVSTVLLVLAALAREVMLVAALGLGIWLWLRGRRKAAIWHAATPLMFVVSWAAYLRWRLPTSDAIEVQEIGPPFVGMAQAYRIWIETPAYLIVAVVVVLVMVLLVRQMVRGRSDPLAYLAVGFVGLAIMLTAQVWRAEFDITRATAPILTAVIVNPHFGPGRDGDQPG